jgi:hypothetical protein
MADTIRDRAAVIALLADNTSGDISPQDLRDFLVSTWGLYGALSFYNKSATQSLNTTPATIVAFDTTGGSDGTSVSTGSHNITVSSGGVWQVETHMTLSGFNSGTLYTFHIAKNGTRIPGASASLKTTSSDYKAFSISLTVSLVNTDIITVQGESDAGGGQTIIPVHGQLLVKRWV